jgi:hypothetical protein
MRMPERRFNATDWVRRVGRGTHFCHTGQAERREARAGMTMVIGMLNIRTTKNARDGHGAAEKGGD